MKQQTERAQEEEMEDEVQGYRTKVEEGGDHAPSL
jgi:hypothetical protein